MISLEEVLEVHNIIIERFGGTAGVRDIKGLESAIFRPFQTFDQQDLYPTTVEKAAAIVESIVKNHPFLDGNKRSGYVLMRLLLLDDGLDIQAVEEEKYQFIINIAEGLIDFDKIVEWIELRISQSK